MNQSGGKSFDEKWITTLRNSPEDLGKRYKAFINIRKFCKDNDEIPMFKKIINEYYI